MPLARTTPTLSRLRTNGIYGPDQIFFFELAKAKNVLTRGGLPRDRFYVREMPWAGLEDADDREPKYPTIITINLTRPGSSGNSAQTSDASPAGR